MDELFGMSVTCKQDEESATGGGAPRTLDENGKEQPQVQEVEREKV